jgi:chemotaxis protein CheD
MIEFTSEETATRTKAPQVFTVDLGEIAVTDDRTASLIAQSLGNGVAVCIWDPETHVAGLVHVLLPDSDNHADLAHEHPAWFANTGIPMLLQIATNYGWQRSRSLIYLLGGAEVDGALLPRVQVGRRNIVAARKALWSAGVLITREITGGNVARSLALSVCTGTLEISAGDSQIVVQMEGNDGGWIR